MALICLLYVLYPAVACIKSVEMFQKLSCLPYVFGCVPACVYIACSKYFRRSHACHMCSILFLSVQSLLMHVFQKLSYLLCGLCLSLCSLTLPQTIRLFNISLRSSGSATTVHRAFLFFDVNRHGHSHKLTSSHALWYYTVGIPS